MDGNHWSSTFYECFIMMNRTYQPKLMAAVWAPGRRGIPTATVVHQYVYDPNIEENDIADIF